VPEPARNTLEKVRHTIQLAAPDAVECISYQIPTFKWNGVLVAFAAHKNHCGFYVMSPEVMQQFDNLLIGYETATATIRFSLSKPLPANLIKKIVRARMKENEAIFLAKKR
jgi:uncharacterized protein YdhG (YjbR/CyaY superfamily)